MTGMLAELGDCVMATWSPAIGDPSVMGWATVAAYGVTALLCLAAFCRHPDRRLRLVGTGLAMVLLALMVNKQLDLQSALTATGRCLSRMQGWYDERRAFQVRFILGLLTVCLVSGLWLLWIMRRYLSQIWMLLLGLICLLIFVAVRAVGFHHFDALINLRLNDVRMNWILELGGLGMIATNALWILCLRRNRLRMSRETTGHR